MGHFFLQNASFYPFGRYTCLKDLLPPPLLVLTLNSYQVEQDFCENALLGHFVDDTKRWDQGQLVWRHRTSSCFLSHPTPVFSQCTQYFDAIYLEEVDLQSQDQWEAFYQCSLCSKVQTVATIHQCWLIGRREGESLVAVFSSKYMVTIHRCLQVVNMHIIVNCHPPFPHPTIVQHKELSLLQ